MYENRGLLPMTDVNTAQSDSWRGLTKNVVLFSHFARQAQKETLAELKVDKTESRMKMTLSSRYENLIMHARREIQKKDENLILKSKQESPLQSGLVNRSSNSNIQPQTPPQESINTMYDFKISNDGIQLSKDPQIIGQTSTDRSQGTQRKLKLENNNLKNPQLGKLSKIEQARYLLLLQNVLKHNIKHKRLSEQRDQIQKTPVGSFSTLHMQQMPQSSQKQPARRNNNYASTQSCDVWSPYKYSTRKEYQKPQHSLRQQRLRNAQNFREEPPLNSSLTAAKNQEEEQQLPAVAIRIANYARAPLLSDPVKSPKNQNASFIDPASIFKGKKKKKSEESALLKKRSTRNNHQRYASHWSVLERGLQQGNKYLSRDSIELLPELSQKRNGQRANHAHSVSMSLSKNFQNNSSIDLIGSLSQQKVIKNSNFREHQQRLKKLIMKRKALQNYKFHQEPREAVEKKNNQVCVDIQCPENLNEDSLYKDCFLDLDEAVALRSDKSLNPWSQSMGGKNNFNSHFDRIASPKSTSMEVLQSQKPEKAMTKRGFPFEEDADLLLISSQILNQRGSSRFQNDQQFSSDSQFQEDVERHSIAVDLRVMEEMHESIKSNYGNWNFPPMNARTEIEKGQDNLSPTLRVRQTHSTLFNQYNLPEYMLHSSMKKFDEKRSNNSRKDTNNMDIDNIFFQYQKINPTLKKSQKRLSTNCNTNLLNEPQSERQELLGTRQYLKTQYAPNFRGFQAKEAPKGASPKRASPKQVRNDKEEKTSKKIIDEESLVKIANEKARAAREMARGIQLEELACQLQPSRSGFFGIGFAPSASNQTSKQSLLRIKTEEVLGQMVQKNQEDCDEETPFQKLINQTSFKHYVLGSGVKQSKKEKAEKILAPKLFKRQLGQTSSSQEKEYSMTAMYRAPPRNQIGSVRERLQNQASTGVAASNLLQKKGIFVGGGGMIGQKPPQPPISFQVFQEMNDQSMQTAYLPGFKFGTPSPSPNLGTFFSNSILEANRSFQNRSKNSSNPTAKRRLAQNIDLLSCLQNTSIELKERQNYEMAKNYSIQSNSRNSSIKIGKSNTTTHFQRNSMQIYGSKEVQSNSAINIKIEKELLSDYGDVLDESQVSLSRSKHKFSTDSRLYMPGTLDLQLVNGQRADTASKKGAFQDKKHSLYVTLSGKSVSEEIESEYLAQANMSVRIGSRNSSSQRKVTKLGYVHGTAILDNIHVVEEVSGKDAICGVSMKSIVQSSCKSPKERVKDKIVNFMRRAQARCMSPKFNMQDNKNQYPNINLEVGENNENCKIEDQELAIKGQSMGELSSARPEQIRSSKIINASSLMPLGALKVNKSQESLPDSPGFKEKFQNVLRIHAYKKPKPVTRIITQSTIFGQRGDREYTGVDQSGGQDLHKTATPDLQNVTLAATDLRVTEQSMQSPYESISKNSFDFRKLRSTPQMNLKLVQGSKGTASLNGDFQEHSTDRQHPSHVIDRKMMSLHDKEELIRNPTIKQEVKEMRKGGFCHINTTNTMEMFNSTIMKIVVTQKKANQEISANGKLNNSKTNQVGSPGFGIDHVFGNSVLINGMNLQMNSSKASQGFIRVGRGVGITGKNNQVHGTRSRQGTMGKFSSTKSVLGQSAALTRDQHVVSRSNDRPIGHGLNFFPAKPKLQANRQK